MRKLAVMVLMSLNQVTLGTEKLETVFLSPHSEEKQLTHLGEVAASMGWDGPFFLNGFKDTIGFVGRCDLILTSIERDAPKVSEGITEENLIPTTRQFLKQHSHWFGVPAEVIDELKGEKLKFPSGGPKFPAHPSMMQVKFGAIGKKFRYKNYANLDGVYYNPSFSILVYKGSIVSFTIGGDSPIPDRDDLLVTPTLLPNNNKLAQLRTKTVQYRNFAGKIVAKPLRLGKIIPRLLVNQRLVERHGTKELAMTLVWDYVIDMQDQQLRLVLSAHTGDILLFITGDHDAPVVILP